MDKAQRRAWAGFPVCGAEPDIRVLRQVTRVPVESCVQYIV